MQAILGDVDGFLDILTGIELIPAVRSQAASVPDPKPVFVEPPLEDGALLGEPVSA